MRLDHFADQLPPKPTDPLLVLLTVAGVVILLCPVAVFLAAAVRFGGEARDRRLAALRLAARTGRRPRGSRPASHCSGRCSACWSAPAAI